MTAKLRPVKYFFTVMLFISLIVFYSGCSAGKRFGKEQFERSEFALKNIRVLIEDAGGQYVYNVKSAVYLKNESEILAQINPGNVITFAAQDERAAAEISGRKFSGNSMEILPVEKNSLVLVKGKKYRGTVKIISRGSKLYIINSLPVEDYLRGVVPVEMVIGKNNENFEALKAFSIAARTYALRRLKENSGKFFDIYSDTRDQGYGGADVEKDLSNRALSATPGMVLTFNDDLAAAFYHASCGGYTEAVENIFGRDAIPYLKSIKDGDGIYCSIAPNFNWEEIYTNNEFVNTLLNSGLIDNSNYIIVENITIVERYASGRVKLLRVLLKNPAGESKEINLIGNDIRFKLLRSGGKGILRSILFNINLERVGGRISKIVIRGQGNGHGVGFCQWGAIYQSRSGKSYTQILYHYFPGTEIGKFYD